MQMAPRPTLSALVSRTKPLVIALSAAMLMSSTGYAASFGHSRIVSNLGQPLRIDVPVTQLSADDLRTLAVSPAPAAAWAQAGLTPPVDLNSMQLRVIDGFSPDTKVIQVSSSQAFDRPVADLLLNVRTASGQQQYQVSILAHGSGALATTAGVSGQAGSAQGAGASAAPQAAIRIQQGDTLWAIAQRHAVPGVSIFQMMVALQRANPQAFIHHNLNLIKAGASLTMPDRAALTAISDREARRIFEAQLQAFRHYRQGMAAQTATVAQGDSAAKGRVTQQAPEPKQNASAAPRDQLKLSAADKAADERIAAEKGIADSQGRVSVLEENVKHLNKALQSQGEAAKDVVVEGAKGLGQSFADVANAVSDVMASGASKTHPAPGADGGHREKPLQQAGGEQPGSSARTSEQRANPSNSPGSNSAVSGGSTPGSAALNSSSSAAGSGGASGSSNTSVSSGDASGSSNPSMSSGASGTSNASVPSGSSESSDASTPSGISGSSNVAGTAGSEAARADSPAADTGASGAAHSSGTTDPSSAGGGISSPENNATDGAALGGATSPAPDVAPRISKKADQAMSWFQEHLLGLVTGFLALIVLLIAWALRRANVARDDHGDHALLVTEAMVKEKLDKINLDLQQPPSDEPRTGGSTDTKA